MEAMDQLRVVSEKPIIVRKWIVFLSLIATLYASSSIAGSPSTSLYDPTYLIINRALVRVVGGKTVSRTVIGGFTHYGVSHGKIATVGVTDNGPEANLFDYETGAHIKTYPLSNIDETGWDARWPAKERVVFNNSGDRIFYFAVSSKGGPLAELDLSSGTNTLRSLPSEIRDAEFSDLIELPGQVAIGVRGVVAFVSTGGKASPAVTVPLNGSAPKHCYVPGMGIYKFWQDGKYDPSTKKTVFLFYMCQVTADNGEESKTQPTSFEAGTGQYGLIGSTVNCALLGRVPVVVVGEVGGQCTSEHYSEGSTAPGNLMCLKRILFLDPAKGTLVWQRELPFRTESFRVSPDATTIKLIDRDKGGVVVYDRRADKFFRLADLNIGDYDRVVILPSPIDGLDAKRTINDASARSVPVLTKPMTSSKVPQESVDQGAMFQSLPITIPTISTTAFEVWRLVRPHGGDALPIICSLTSSGSVVFRPGNYKGPEAFSAVVSGGLCLGNRRMLLRFDVTDSTPNWPTIDQSDIERSDHCEVWVCGGRGKRIVQLGLGPTGLAEAPNGFRREAIHEWLPVNGGAVEGAELIGQRTSKGYIMVLVLNASHLTSRRDQGDQLHICFSVLDVRVKADAHEDCMLASAPAYHWKKCETFNPLILPAEDDLGLKEDRGLISVAKTSDVEIYGVPGSRDNIKTCEGFVIRSLQGTFARNESLRRITISEDKHSRTMDDLMSSTLVDAHTLRMTFRLPAGDFGTGNSANILIPRTAIGGLASEISILGIDTDRIRNSSPEVWP